MINISIRCHNCERYRSNEYNIFGLSNIYVSDLGYLHMLVDSLLQYDKRSGNNRYRFPSHFILVLRIRLLVILCTIALCWPKSPVTLEPTGSFLTRVSLSLKTIYCIDLTTPLPSADLNPLLNYSNLPPSPGRFSLIHLPFDRLHEIDHEHTNCTTTKFINNVLQQTSMSIVWILNPPRYYKLQLKSCQSNAEYVLIVR